ncbi:MAG: tripartite tricarboxylate transporter substrate binding protein [Albidovulum sp.]|nr:tripartite tricarboxylate transporter substrate binding protein [Albidovulum sp.]
MQTVKSLLVAAFASLLFFSIHGARAEYPEKPINMIIGFPAGGGTDLAGRVLAKELQEILGQPVVVVNRPGAASMIAADSVAKSRPDGYTVWFGSAGTLVTREALGRSPVAFGEGLKMAGLTGHLVAALGVPVGSPFQSVHDIIDAAKASPGTLRWSHNGVGAAFMAMGQGFVTANELDVVGVPFQGAANLRQALAASQTDFGVLNAGDRLRLGDEQFRILGVIAGTRDLVIDDALPTLAELEINFIEVPSPIGVLVPGGVSEEVVNRLAEAIEEATQRVGFVEGMSNIFIPVTYMNAQDSDAYVREVRANVDRLLPQLTP